MLYFNYDIVQVQREVIVSVSASADGASERCAVVDDGSLLDDSVSYNTQRITCAAGVKGRFVKIAVTGLDQYLSMCEVQIYGVAGSTFRSYKWSRLHKLATKYVIHC